MKSSLKVPVQSIYAYGTPKNLLYFHTFAHVNNIIAKKFQFHSYVYIIIIDHNYGKSCYLFSPKIKSP